MLLLSFNVHNWSNIILIVVLLIDHHSLMPFFTTMRMPIHSKSISGIFNSIINIYHEHQHSLFKQLHLADANERKKIDWKKQKCLKANYKKQIEQGKKSYDDSHKLNCIPCICTIKQQRLIQLNSGRPCQQAKQKVMRARVVKVETKRKQMK